MAGNLKLPLPPPQWNQNWQQRVNQTQENHDLDNRKKRTDIEMETGTRLILRSPDGHRWQVQVSDAGVVSATVLP